LRQGTPTRCPLCKSHLIRTPSGSYRQETTAEGPRPVSRRSFALAGISVGSLALFVSAGFIIHSLTPARRPPSSPPPGAIAQIGEGEAAPRAPTDARSLGQRQETSRRGEDPPPKPHQPPPTPAPPAGQAGPPLTEATATPRLAAAPAAPP